MANLQKIPLNNASGFSGRQIPECGGQYERGAYASANAAVYDYRLVNNETVTKQDGTRHLVNKGIKGGEFPILTGQAIVFDGTQEIATGVVLDFDQDFTVLLNQEDVSLTADNQQGSFVAGVRSLFGMSVTGLSLGLGHSTVTLPITRSIGQTYSIAIRYKAQSAKATITLINTLSISAEITVNKSLIPGELHLGGVNGLASMSGAVSGFYLLQQYLTERELIKHYQRPEYTLYKQNGLLRSSFLTQKTLDKLINGEGCWYPLTEGAGATVHNNALNVPQGTVVINAGNSDIWGNGTSQPSGYQTALITRDSLGLPSGLSSSLNFNAPGKVNLLNSTLIGDWYLDVYVDGSSSKIFQRTFLRINSEGNESLLIYISANQEFLKTRLHSVYKGIIGKIEAVVSFESKSGVLSVYANGEFLEQSDRLEVSSSLIAVSEDLILSGDIQFELSGIGRGSRTSEERKTMTKKIMQKHGVS